MTTKVSEMSQVSNNDPSVTKIYDLTSNWDPWVIGFFSLISCGIPCFGCWLWDKVTLTLEPEEVTLVTQNSKIHMEKIHELPWIIILYQYS